MKKELVIVLDFGGQYNQLVARRVRECNVYCEIYSYKTDIEKIKAMNPKGIILTGGPNSCYEPDSPTYTDELFKLGIPVLGLCYGAQLMSHVLGGKVERADVREYGKTEVIIDKRESKVFEGVSEKTICWMSHFDYISKIAPGFEISAHTADCPVAAAENEAEKLYAIQFHPEVLHTAEGTKMINNFVKNVCECVGDWKMDAFVENTIKEIREKVGDGRVLLALSGGVDSSVAAGLLSRAIGKQLTCVFVDHGLLRKNEGDEVEAVFGPNGQFDLNFIRVNAQERYYNKLAGVTEPEAKRKIIGEEFIRIFEEEAKKIEVEGREDPLAIINRKGDADSIEFSIPSPTTEELVAFCGGSKNGEKWEAPNSFETINKAFCIATQPYEGKYVEYTIVNGAVSAKISQAPGSEQTDLLLVKVTRQSAIAADGSMKPSFIREVKTVTPQA